MKRILLTSTLLLSAFLLSAQSMNGGFETWGASAQEPEQPTGWITANLFASPLLTIPNPNPNPTSAFKAGAPDNYMGTWSLRLKTVVLVLNPDSTTIPDTLGACISGSFTMIPSFAMKDRIPFTGRPAILNFAAKYAPNGVDTASVYVQMTKWNGASRDIIMEVWVPINPSTSYNNYSIPLSSSYQLSTLPDSISIGITASSGYYPRVNSELHIDNISFSGWVGIDENDDTAPVTVYPNPVTESLTVDASALGTDLLALEIYDVNGKLVMNTSLRNISSLTLDVRMLPAGTYSYTVRSTLGIGMGNGKFIKE
ncbi:MAG: T9SS type A sorting domain-containing protein [Bacteroidia bacterium]|nr:T9SS type A sorting domain-containing protein [Bacteroidia bacterium]